MTGPGTPRRTFRVPDALYDRAATKAAREGTTLTAVIVAALEEYVEGEGVDTITKDDVGRTVTIVCEGVTTVGVIADVQPDPDVAGAYRVTVSREDG